MYATPRYVYFARFETGIISVSSFFDAINMEIVAYVNYPVFIVTNKCTNNSLISSIIYSDIRFITYIFVCECVYVCMCVQLVKDHLCIYRNSLDLRSCSPSSPRNYAISRSRLVGFGRSSNISTELLANLRIDAILYV